MSTNGCTREAILSQACTLAGRVGLAGLSIGALARSLARPKSTIFFHFGSLERLQLMVVDQAARALYLNVVRPALGRTEGLPRLRRLFEGWLVWDGASGFPGGCLLVAAASEFDDRPGPVRDRLVQLHLLWEHLLQGLIEGAVQAGTFPPGLDRAQFRHELLGILLAYHHASRLLDDPDAPHRARVAFAALVRRSETASRSVP